MDIYVLVNGWQRKASAWAAPMARITPAAQATIDALPQIPVATAYPCATLPFAAPQYFVAVRPNGDRFLVDTEDHDGSTTAYARYIVRLEAAL